jgi:hypothetical protein
MAVASVGRDPAIQGSLGKRRPVPLSAYFLLPEIAKFAN